MRYAFRSAGLAAVAALLATVALFRPRTAQQPAAEKATSGGKTFYTSKQADFELYFPDDRQHVVLGMTGTLADYLKREVPQTGPMSYGLRLAATGRPVVASVNIAAIPIPPDFVK